MKILKIFCSAGMAAGLLCGAADATAQTQNFPTRPVVLLLPYAAGGSVDVLARQLANKLSQTWGQPVVPDNRPGANGLIATQVLMKAPADGYTLMLHLTGMIQNPMLLKGANYDALKDVTPIAQIGTQGMALAVPGKSPIKSIEQLVALGKQKTGGPSFGSIGIGNTGHIWSEQLLSEKGMQGAHIAYKGAGPMLIDLLNDRLDWAFLGPVDAVVRSSDQSVRILAVTGMNRIKQLPEAPTMRELGLPGFELTGWYGVFGPPRMPKELVSKIEKDVQEAIADPEFQKLLDTNVIARTGLRSDEFSKAMRADQPRWQALINKFNIKPE